MIDISVIIPLYRGEKYLNYWSSILEINFKKVENIYNIQCEAVFVNDYPDEKIELQDRREYIRIFNLNENNGIHGARVFGYFKSRGNYIVFLDQDDMIAENFLLSQWQKIKDADFIVCNGYMQRFCMDGKKRIYGSAQIDWVKNLDNYIKGQNWIVSPGQVLIRKEAIPEEWLVNVMKKNGADDYFLWILMLKNKCKCEVNEDLLYTHVENGENTSGNIHRIYDSILEMVDLLRKNEILNASNINIIENRIICNKKNDSTLKMSKIIQIYDYWLYLKNRGISLKTYFQKYKYKKVAIYGVNYLGNRLCDELSDNKITVVCGIDKLAEMIEYDIPIFTIEDIIKDNKLSEIEVVIITAMVDDKMLSDIKRIIDKPVIMLAEIILELINDMKMFEGETIDENNNFRNRKVL